MATSPLFFLDIGLACGQCSESSTSLELLRSLSERSAVVAAAVASARAGTAVAPGEAYGAKTAALFTAALAAAETHRARGIYGPGCCPRDHWDACLRSGDTGCAVETARGLVLLIRWCLDDAKAMLQRHCSAPSRPLLPPMPLGMQQFSCGCYELDGPAIALPEDGSSRVAQADLAERGPASETFDLTSQVVLVSQPGRDHFSVVLGINETTWLSLSDHHAEVVGTSPLLASVALPVLLGAVSRVVGGPTAQDSATIFAPSLVGTIAPAAATDAAASALRISAYIAASAAVPAAVAASLSSQGEPCDLLGRSAAARAGATLSGPLPAASQALAASPHENSDLSQVVWVSEEIAAGRRSGVPPGQLATWRAHRDTQRKHDAQMFDARRWRAERYFADTTAEALRWRAHVALLNKMAIPSMKAAEKKQALEQEACRRRRECERTTLFVEQAKQRLKDAHEREVLAGEKHKRSLEQRGLNEAAAGVAKAARKAARAAAAIAKAANALAKAAAASAAEQSRLAALARAAATADADSVLGQARRREAASCSSSVPRGGERDQCGLCQSPASHRCSGCKSQWYCCDAHQKAHWSVHRPECKRPQAQNERIPPLSSASAAEAARAAFLQPESGFGEVSDMLGGFGIRDDVPNGVAAAAPRGPDAQKPPPSPSCDEPLPPGLSGSCATTCPVGGAWRALVERPLFRSSDRPRCCFYRSARNGCTSPFCRGLFNRRGFPCVA